MAPMEKSCSPTASSGLAGAAAGAARADDDDDDGPAAPTRACSCPPPVAAGAMRGLVAAATSTGGSASAAAACSCPLPGHTSRARTSMAAAAVRFLPDAIVVDPWSTLASLVSLEHDQVATNCLLLSMSSPEAALFIALPELARCALHYKACNGVCNWVDGRIAHVVLSLKIIRVWHSGHSLILSSLHHRSLIWTSARPLSGP
jgi:hypothetical protein